PESASVRADGQVYISGFDFNNNPPGVVNVLDPVTGTVSFFTSQVQNPQFTTTGGTGGVWVGDFFNDTLPSSGGALHFDDSANLPQAVGYFGSQQAQTDPAGNIWNSNFDNFNLFRFDPAGNQQLAVFTPGATGLTVWGVDNPNPPPQDT